MQTLEKALEQLEQILRQKAHENRISIAYSGGLDSRFLSFFAHRCGLIVELLHASASHVSATESKEALERAFEMGLEVRIVRPRLPSPAELAAAGRQRCYVCKRAIFSVLLKEASAPLCDGSNASDALVFRPGSRAVKELRVLTPLADAGLTKPMIRTAAKMLGLTNPGQLARPCLLTRFDYGDAPDARRLHLTEQAEDFLSGLSKLKAGFRLRWLGEQALLHISAQNAPAQEDLEAIRKLLLEKLPELGSVRIEVMENLSGWFDRRRTQ